MIFKNPFSVFESLSLFHLIGGTLGTRLISAYLRERICIHLFQKTLSERTANGSCRTEIARPKGTVVSTFGMQKQCVLHVALN